MYMVETIWHSENSKLINITSSLWQLKRLWEASLKKMYMRFFSDRDPIPGNTAFDVIW